VPSGDPATEAARLQRVNRERPIGVFDSGVGGLTVLHELLVALPHEDFLYLGDTARFPYGTRPKEQLEAFALDVAGELVARHAKLLVVACNSATAGRAAGAEAAVRLDDRRDRGGRPGVAGGGGRHPQRPHRPAGDARDRRQRAYEHALQAADPHVRLHAVACPTWRRSSRAASRSTSAWWPRWREYCAR
jgi:glutamate racemase